jgi:guanylate kinase
MDFQPQRKGEMGGETYYYTTTETFIENPDEFITIQTFIVTPENKHHRNGIMV